jgi:hypothetical protein
MSCQLDQPWLSQALDFCRDVHTYAPSGQASPAGFDHAGNIAAQGQLPEAEAAYAKLA